VLVYNTEHLFKQNKTGQYMNMKFRLETTIFFDKLH